MKLVQISLAAANDLLTIAEFLESESGNPFLGDRFLSTAAATFDLIESHSLIGRARKLHHPRLAPLRSLPINNPFGKYLIFYQPHVSMSLVIRVLHSAQDIATVLQLGPDDDA